MADADETPAVERRIRAALASNQGWELLAVERLAVDEQDEPLARRLLAGPRAGA